MFGKSQKELLKAARQIVQPLQKGFHKGQAGRVGVFGGCEDYTGAPFFAAHLAALTGADLCHIVCEKQAAPIIKTYLPDLMVHPYMYESLNPAARELGPAHLWETLASQSLEDALQSADLARVVEERVFPRLASLVDRLDVLVVGPGLGRDPLMLKTVERVVQEAKVANKPVVFDADALFLVSLNPGLVKNYTKAVLTPNVAEFARLCNVMNIQLEDKAKTAHDHDAAIDATAKLLNSLGGVVIVRKGEHELIVRGETHVFNGTEGSLRRVGGQGDTLAGAIATMLVWGTHYTQGFWQSISGPGESGGNQALEATREVTEDNTPLLACYAACSLVRTASRLAYARYHRAMQTSNVHEFLGEAYHELFSGEED